MYIYFTAIALSYKYYVICMQRCSGQKRSLYGTLVVVVIMMRRRRRLDEVDLYAFVSLFIHLLLYMHGIHCE